MDVKLDSGSSSSVFYTSGLDKVASNDDLLLEIIFRLPVKSLLRFKSVSKHWLSLISNPPLLHLLRRHRKPSGLLVHWRSHISISYLDFITFNNNHGDVVDRPFFPNRYDILYLTCCNGLVCWVDNSSFHVMNPTTREFVTLPQPHLSQLTMEGLTLAFDPSRSLHYKLVSLWTNSTLSTADPLGSYFQVEIYSSDTRSWKVLDLNFTSPYRQRPNFYRGTYWNDAIIWFCNYGDSVYFRIEEERIGTIPRLNMSFQEEGKEICYGESGGHFYVVEKWSSTPSIVLKVSELMDDFSGWVSKYTADLGEVGRAFPETMDDLPGMPTRFRVLSMVWGGGEEEEEGEEAYLVLMVPGKMIRFNLEKKGFREVCEVGKVTCIQDGKRTYGSSRYTFCRLDSHHYFHSLFTVSPSSSSSQLG